MSQSFLAADETALIARFLADGYVIIPVEDAAGLTQIQSAAAAIAAAKLALAKPLDAQAFLDTIHDHVDAARLNELRLGVFDGLNGEAWFRPAYFSLARKALETLVGNELAMQLRVNLSIQLPGDDSSLLPVHSDIWNGDSAYEVVAWLPLVDCRRTKSMFLLPPEPNRRALARFAALGRSSEDVYQAVESDLLWLEVKAGEILIFSPTLMHGNRVNEEKGTRWSMNCRFKGLFTPYADKRLGEFFEPITLRPTTRIGAAFRLPQVAR
jgi:sporadic carbohydrate cluster 2OG-Fe(II) oxygenase